MDDTSQESSPRKTVAVSSQKEKQISYSQQQALKSLMTFQKSLVNLSAKPIRPENGLCNDVETCSIS